MNVRPLVVLGLAWFAVSCGSTERDGATASQPLIIDGDDGGQPLGDDRAVVTPSVPTSSSPGPTAPPAGGSGDAPRHEEVDTAVDNRTDTRTVVRTVTSERSSTSGGRSMHQRSVDVATSAGTVSASLVDDRIVVEIDDEDGWRSTREDHADGSVSIHWQRSDDRVGVVISAKAGTLSVRSTSTSTSRASGSP